MKYVDAGQVQKRMNFRLLLNAFSKVIFFLATIFGLVVLGILIYRVLSDGISWINIDFFNWETINNA